MTHTSLVLVATIVVFLIVGAIFLAVNLLLGQWLRPNRPNADKGDIYECGEEPIGTAWGQFDLRFYVVALLYVIFDVEIAFFFPWAVVFGQANRNGNETLARLAFIDFMIFFGILLVGFAYLWKRGDLAWVRSTTSPERENV